MKSLECRFKQFMLQLSSVEDIDSISLSEENRKFKKADYFALDRYIIFEQKEINSSQTDKINQLMSSYQDESYFPVFYGERDLNIILGSFPNRKRKEVEEELYNKTTRLLENYLSTANKQIESTSEVFGISDYSGVLIILNDKVATLSPNIIYSRVFDRLKERKKDGLLRFHRINYVFILSETHLYKNKYPSIIIIESPSVKNPNNKTMEYLNYLSQAWATFNGNTMTSVAENEGELFFENLEENKKEIDETEFNIEELSQKKYRENPYMRTWSDNKVLEFGATLVDTLGLKLSKKARKYSTDELSSLMLILGDFIEETNYRGLDLREMQKYYKNNKQDK